MGSSRTDVDVCLREEIVTQLMADRRTRTAVLRVGVLNRIAHLAGRVESLEARSAAEEIAQRVSGVRGVVNRIEAPGAPDPGRAINIKLQKVIQKKEQSHDQVTKQMDTEISPLGSYPNGTVNIHNRGN